MCGKSANAFWVCGTCSGGSLGLQPPRIVLADPLLVQRKRPRAACAIGLNMNGKRRPKPGSVLWGARKFLVILLLIKLQQLCWLAAAIQTGNDTIDISWVFSLKSVSRMVPLQQHTEASRRLQDILTGDSLNFDRPITILLHQSPLQSHQQLLLFHASREAFAEEERLMPGIFVSHFRTLLVGYSH
ncbi:uncharacterized protein LOC34621741 [Cyclospora cayetanensis]|uniref:Uncharacterized protein LOC34621741 n=1 Tax=Cyclospora cayetanensis TaxID=88456 RepID=A0A6P6RRQ5_9EIME|nr:uncharacterized protein LOC34621741 [Cyclospora cayetanensis]